jgi:hypothetical protein
MKRFLVVWLIAAAVIWSSGVSNASHAAGLAGVLDSDFNGDGYQDLVVGIPGRDVNYQGITQNEAGAVEVWNGSSTGPVRGAAWTKKSSGVMGNPVAGEQWGSQTESADFNDDGYSDLVVTSSPGSAFNILYGSSTGLTADGDRRVPVAGLILGIATGDFDGDGYGDLAVGSACDPDFSVRCVLVWYGSGSGLDTSSTQTWTQDTPGIPDSTEPGDDFGRTLTSGDFNGDGADDLSVGATCESFGSLACPGQVWTIYGSPSGLTATGAQKWNQDTAGIKGIAESFEYFSWDQTTGDFNDDGYEDLAVAAPGASREINLLYGSSSGLTATGNQFSTGGLFWESFASGDFNGDGRSDLAAGCFDCGTGGIVRTWAGSASGLDLAHPTDWTQDSPGIGDHVEMGDGFGGALASGGFGKGPEDDLAVGAFDEGRSGLFEVGIVHAIYGSAGGLTGTGSQLLKEKVDTQYDLYGYSLNGAEDESH